MMLKDQEIFKIKERVKFNFDQQKWIVPPFYVRDKTVSFPKIKNRKEFVKEELNKRELVWNDNNQVIGEEGTGQSS